MPLRDCDCCRGRFWSAQDTFRSRGSLNRMMLTFCKDREAKRRWDSDSALKQNSSWKRPALNGCSNTCAMGRRSC